MSISLWNKEKINEVKWRKIVFIILYLSNPLLLGTFKILVMWVEDRPGWTERSDSEPSEWNERNWPEAYGRAQHSLHAPLGVGSLPPYGLSSRCSPTRPSLAHSIRSVRPYWILLIILSYKLSSQIISFLCSLLVVIIGSCMLFSLNSFFWRSFFYLIKELINL